jgi:hypothetical protein
VELVNEIVYPAQLLVLPDPGGRETLLVVAKATYTIAMGTCVPAEEPVPLLFEEEHYGEPGKSSVRRETDLGPVKPATDVILLGHAYAPNGKAKESSVSLCVGPVAREVRVFGDRRFAVVLGLPHVDGPEPFDRMPLTWERAFGGVQPLPKGDGYAGAEERNPVGTGFVAKRDKSFIDGLRLPNIEDPKSLLKSPGQKRDPAGFGFVARHWLPRRPLFGTYDAAWMNNRMPLPPEDLDERAFCGAPEALQARPHLQGGEPVRLEGASSHGPLAFELPRVSMNWEAKLGDVWIALAPVIDTLILEPDESRCTLTWRARLDIHGRVRKVRGVRLRAEAAR